MMLDTNATFDALVRRNAETAEQAEAILDWVALHEQSETGEVPFRQWPDRMRGHFIARIPRAPA